MLSIRSTSEKRRLRTGAGSTCAVAIGLFVLSGCGGGNSGSNPPQPADPAVTVPAAASDPPTTADVWQDPQLQQDITQANTDQNPPETIPTPTTVPTYTGAPPNPFDPNAGVVNQQGNDFIQSMGG